MLLLYLRSDNETEKNAKNYDTSEKNFGASAIALPEK